MTSRAASSALAGAANDGALMSWMTFQLSSEQMAQGHGIRVLKQFLVEWTRVGAPSDMAMFSTHCPNGHFITYFLSPGTLRHAPGIVRSLGAKPGERPPDGAKGEAVYDCRQPHEL